MSEKSILRLLNCVICVGIFVIAGYIQRPFIKLPVKRPFNVESADVLTVDISYYLYDCSRYWDERRFYGWIRPMSELTQKCFDGIMGGVFEKIT